MALRPLSFRHRELPSLPDRAEQEVVEEFRRVEEWSLNVTARLAARPPWGGDTAPACTDDGAVPYYDCANGMFAPSALAYVAALPNNPARDGFLSSAVLSFDYDQSVIFRSSTNDLLGGLGTVASAGDELLLIGTVDIDQWENISTRRPLAIGGSEFLIDAGSSFKMRVPGIGPYDTGYTLQIASDGETVLAAPNPPPDWSGDDTSNSDGWVLLSGTGATPWEVFPDNAASAADKLTVVVPNGTLAGNLFIRIKVRVLNTSSQAGTVDIGFGVDGAAPLADDFRNFIIPNNFEGSLDATFIFAMASDLTADLPAQIWYKGEGYHPSFTLETDTAEGLHTFEVSISYGGGGGGSGTLLHDQLQNRNLPQQHMATAVSVDPTGATHITASQVQGALDELDGAIITDHASLSGLSGAGVHPAASILFDPTGTSHLAGAATSQAAIVELDNLVIVDHSELTGLDNPDDHPASAISFDPTGLVHITSSTVRGALVDLDAAIRYTTIARGGWQFVGAASGAGVINVSAGGDATLNANSRTLMPGTFGMALFGTTGGLRLDDAVVLAASNFAIHCVLGIKSNTAGVVRLGFQNGGISGSVFDTAVCEHQFVTANAVYNVSFSCVAEDITDYTIWYARVRNQGGSTIQLSIVSMSFWIEAV